MAYKLPPGTDYQRAIRTGSKQLWNHCSANWEKLCMQDVVRSPAVLVPVG